MSIRTCLALLLGVLAAFAAAADPAPANVTPAKGKPLPGVFVLEETMDGITVIDDPKSATPVKSQFKPGEYTVDYKASLNPDYLKGDNFEKVKDADKAIASYTAALTSARYDWERQAAYLGLARMAEAAKRYDVGVQALQGYEKDYPKGLALKDALFMRGRLLGLKGDSDGATKTLQTLIGHEKDWGAAAAALGAVGIAEILAGDGKDAAKEKQAAAELAPWLPKLDPVASSEDFAKVGLALAAHQIKAGDAAGLDTLKRVALSPCGADDQARAHLALAKALADKGDPASALGAFDHAAIAATLKGADSATRGGALSLAASLVSRIAATGADENAKNKLSIEYKGYLSKLQ